MNLHAFQQLQAGCSVTTALPSLDVETFSQAGYFFNNLKERYQSLVKNSPGLKGVGAAVYAEDPSTELLLLSFDLRDGKGVQLWVKGMDPPEVLFRHIRSGGLLESHNAGFEFLIWHYVCHLRLGWPALPLEQQRCSMAKAQAFSLPGKLDKLTEVLNTEIKKNKDGTRLIRIFTIPRSPTKHDKRQRIQLIDKPNDAFKFCLYNIDDVRSESEVSSRCPDLSPFELEVWKTSQRINMRGVLVDVEALENCISIFEQAREKYTTELKQLTCGAVSTVDEVENMRDYLAAHGVKVPGVDKDIVKETLKRADLPFNVRRVLLIRQWLAMASVKKLNAINRRRCSDDRLRDLFNYYGALTGRWSGSGVQPQNLASSGPVVDRCESCGHFQARGRDRCLWCNGLEVQKAEWCLEAAEDVLTVVKGRSLSVLEYYFKDALKALSGCLRALFIAKPGHDLICSDYSAIEAVVLAELAGETWRQEVFRTHGKIYETTAAKITRVPFEEILEHKERTGQHHPHRKPLGKIPELASGYQGWIGAWKQFGADEFFDTDAEIKAAILKWREDSPAIVEFWGGQWRKDPHRWHFTQEFFGIEGAAVCAVLNPGQAYQCRSITYQVKDDVLYCRLPSGRLLTYHEPRLTVDRDNYSQEQIFKLSYMGWNSDSTKGPVGWLRIGTYGGKLVENITQAVARDILANALVNVEAAGFPVVLHVHDELVVEVPKKIGSIEEIEAIMMKLPAWCSDWPIKAAGGWRGLRYRKD
jgi:DNA polymerase